MLYTYKEFASYVKGVLDSVKDGEMTRELLLIQAALEITGDNLIPDWTTHGQLITIPCSDMPDEVPYGELCSCNPKNGGSGICGCIMGNKLVPNPKKNIHKSTTNFKSE